MEHAASGQKPKPTGNKEEAIQKQIHNTNATFKKNYTERTPEKWTFVQPMGAVSFTNEAQINFIIEVHHLHAKKLVLKATAVSTIQPPVTIRQFNYTGTPDEIFDHLNQMADVASVNHGRKRHRGLQPSLNHRRKWLPEV
jgi:hypothetical protein